MIVANKKTGELEIVGKGKDLIEELAVITSEIEKMIAKEVGVDMAEKIVNGAIIADRKYNHTHVYSKTEEGEKNEQ